MKRLVPRALLCTSLAALLASACTRDTDDPPIIPLPAAPPATTANRPPADPPPPVLPPVPLPAATPKPTASAAPSAAPSASSSAAPVAVTPYQIPWPSPLPSLPIFPSVDPSASPAPGSAEPQADARVIVYGTRWCPACKRLQQDLEARKVPFVFVDVEDARALATPAGVHVTEIPSNMRGGVPVTRVVQKSNNLVWVQGCDPDRIEKAHRG